MTRFLITTAMAALIGGAALAQGTPQGPLPGVTQETIGAICMPLDKLRVHLKAKFNEDEIGGGIVNERTITLLFVSPGGSTWTIALADPSGKACVISGGKDWFAARVPALGERGA